MSEYTNEYTMNNIPRDALEDTELISTLNGLDRAEPYELYQVWFRGERGENTGGTAAELLYLPAQARAGIAFQNEVIWADASSAEEAMERYLDHTIAEDDSPPI